MLQISTNKHSLISLTMATLYSAVHPNECHIQMVNTPASFRKVLGSTLKASYTY